MVRAYKRRKLEKEQQACQLAGNRPARTQSQGFHAQNAREDFQQLIRDIDAGSRLSSPAVHLEQPSNMMKRLSNSRGSTRLASPFISLIHGPDDNNAMRKRFSSDINELSARLNRESVRLSTIDALKDEANPGIAMGGSLTVDPLPSYRLSSNDMPPRPQSKPSVVQTDVNAMQRSYSRPVSQQCPAISPQWPLVSSSKSASNTPRSDDLDSASERPPVMTLTASQSDKGNLKAILELESANHELEETINKTQELIRYYRSMISKNNRTVTHLKQIQGKTNLR
jgi:hypothetical protein